MITHSGVEHVVDAYGCSPAALRSRRCLARVLRRAIRELALHPVGGAVWHEFPDPGGITGLVLLSESHFTVHTYPEIGYAAFNLYCCRFGIEWPWRTRLTETLGATDVIVRTLVRGRNGSGVRADLALDPRWPRCPPRVPPT